MCGSRTIRPPCRQLEGERSKDALIRVDWLGLGLGLVVSFPIRHLYVMCAKLLQIR